MLRRSNLVPLMIVGFLVLSGHAVGQTPEELLAIHEAQLTAMNNHDLDGMMSHWADDGIYDLVSMPPPVPAMYVRFAFQERFTARPDFRMEMKRVMAVDNMVVEEGTTLYTHPPTGVEIILPHVSIYEFEGDKIKKVTSYNDRLGPMVARGEVDAPAMPDLVPSGDVPAPEATGLSPLEANAELIQRWNSHDAAAVAKMDHADLQIFAHPLGMYVDRAQMMALNEQYFTSFPDDVLEVVRTVDLGDGWVLTEFISKATHQAAFMGVEASGYLMEVRVVWLTQYNADGLVVEMSFYYDNLTLITQMTTPEWSPAGTWISAIPTPLGNLLINGAWIPQDTTGTRFIGQYEFPNNMPLLVDLFPDSEKAKHAGSVAVKAGRNKYDITFLWHYTKTTGPSQEEIVGYGVVTGTFELLSPDSLWGQGVGAYYLAAQDADQNGFPDEGEEPIACLPWGWTGQRLTIMPGCIPAPMP